MISAVKRASARVAAKRLELTDILSSESEAEYENEAEADEEVDDDEDDDQDSENDFDKSDPQISHPPQSQNAAHVLKRRRIQSNDEFLENPLYKALSSVDADVSDLALEWIESYADDVLLDESNAITDLFNLVLRCCGCVHLTKNHDMINADSAPATVAELGVLFEKQRYHEYPFVSTNKAIKFFRRNVLEFFESLVLVSHEKGMLYTDVSESTSSSLSSSMMNDILAWLTALCSSNVRPFRYVSTSILMVIQTTLCEQSVSLMVSLEKQQRQLDIAKNKKVRNHSAQQRKIEIISESIDRFNRQYDTLAEYLGDIFVNVFVRRFRDIDSGIRLECVKALGLWMTIHEDYFLQAKYLRYLGWLLSDPNEHVREEVTKSLHKLYKHVTSRSETMNIGFRQFTERFKKQFINMIWRETHANTKLQLFGIYNEIYKLGYFGDQEIIEIGLYGFYLVESSSKQEKVKSEWGKLVSLICLDKTTKDLERYSVFLSTHTSSMFGDDENQLQIDQCLRFKNLAKYLQESYSHFVESKRPSISILSQNLQFHEMVAQLFSSMYPLSDVLGSWILLIRYVLCDVSSAKFENEDSPENVFTQEDELKERLEINSNSERLILLSFILGAFTHIGFKKQSRRSEDEISQDNITVALPMLSQYLNELEKYLSKAPDLYVVFMHLWVIILVPLSQSFGNMHNREGNLDEYNLIHGRILEFYADVEDFDDSLLKIYEQYFALMLKNFNSEDSNDHGRDSEVLSSTAITVKVEDLLTTLTAEAVNSFNSKDLIDDFNGDDINTILPEDQKMLCNKILKSSNALQKLGLIAKMININKYITEPILDFESSLLDFIATKFLSKIDFRSLIELWPNNYLKILSSMESAWKAVLDVVLISLCWKLEDLVFASNDLSALQISIDVFLDDFDVLLKSLALLFESVQLSYKNLNENSADSSGPMRHLVEKLVNLSKLIGNQLIDAMLSLRVFYQRLRGGNSFRNFDTFFSDMDGVGQYVQGTVPRKLQDSFLNVFLIEEAQVAKLLSEPLERGENEDVNLEDFCFLEPVVVEVPVHVEPTEFGGSDDEEDDLLGTIDPRVEEQAREAEQVAKLENKRKQVLWDAEKSLYVYVVKLLSLANTGGFAADILQRMELNADILGDFYKKILEGGKKSNQQEDIDHLVTSQVDIMVEN